MNYVLSAKGFITITPSKEGNYLYNGYVYSTKVFTKSPKYWEEVTEKHEL